MDDESPRESQSGYPEEEPAEVAGGEHQERSEDTPQRQGGRSGEGEQAGGGDDDETATGNPHAADG